MGNPVLYYESGQLPQAWALMTTDDNQTFFSAFSPWAGTMDTAVDIRPYGVATGGRVTPAASGTNNLVDVAALTAYMVGSGAADADGLVTVAADTDIAITRPTTGKKISSVTVDNTGALAVVTGTDGADFTETRGVAGGPPYIPAGSVEVAQVRLASTVAAPITASDIYQPGGVALERFDFPVFPTQDYAEGSITFSDALPLIHTGDTPKRVYARGATPVFSEQPYATDWVPAEASKSSTSTDTYTGPIGSVSSTLNNATFTVAKLRDGITDSIMAAVDERIWVRFKPDRDKMPYQLTLGYLSIARAYPAGGGTTASFTLVPETKTVNYQS